MSVVDFRVTWNELDTSMFSEVSRIEQNCNMICIPRWGNVEPVVERGGDMSSGDIEASK